MERSKWGNLAGETKHQRRARLEREAFEKRYGASPALLAKINNLTIRKLMYQLKWSLPAHMPSCRR